MVPQAERTVLQLPLSQTARLRVDSRPRDPAGREKGRDEQRVGLKGI
jgi:hypothetical protein